MARVHNLELLIAVAECASAALSARTVCNVLMSCGAVPHSLVDVFPDFLDASGLSLAAELRFEAINLFSAKSIDGAALRAGEILIKPSDRYIDFVAAVAGSCEVTCDIDPHGWPILSSVCGNSTMAEGAVLSRHSPGSAEQAVA